jgi:hypothetical protein
LRRRLLVAAMALAMTVPGGIALAKAGDPGSPGNKGLCNAYAHNSQQGKDHGQAFLRLAETAGDYNGDGTRDASDVMQYCAENVPPVGN